ncbi:hypothetical protein RJ035_006777 [Blastomyces gilchristii]
MSAANGERNGAFALHTPEGEKTKSELAAQSGNSEPAPADSDLKQILKALVEGQKELLGRWNLGSGGELTKHQAAPASKEKDPKDEADLQEIAIKRVSPGDWRKVKKEGKIDLQESILLVSSKAYARSQLRRLGYKLPRILDKKSSEAATESSSEMIPNDWTALPQNVFVRPFKYLVAYESDIRQCLKEAETAYDQAVSRRDEMRQENPTTNVRKSNNKAGNVVNKPEQQNPARVTKDDDTNNAGSSAAPAKRERDELRCLVKFMDTDMHDIFDAKRRISDGDITEIAFEHLWLLFKPGDVVLNSSSDENRNCRQAYRVLNITGGRAYFDSGYKARFSGIIDYIGDSDSENEEKCGDAIKCSGMDTTCFIIDAFYIDFDGVKLGARSKRFAIPPYKGTRPVTSLVPFPLLPSPESEQIQQTLIERGRRFVQLVPGTHKKYSGLTVQEGNQTSKGRKNWIIKETELHSEIVVDQAAGVEHFKQKVSQFGRSLKFGSGAIAKATPQDKKETFDPLPEQEDGNWITDVFDDSKFEEDRQNDFRRTTNLLDLRTLQQKPVPNDHLMLLPYRAYGYGLLDHKWLPLNINKIEDLPVTGQEAQGARFEDLVLPEGHRVLLQALIKNQVEHPKEKSGGTDGTHEPLALDAVLGKCKGLIILLHGAPGVGKTSTAKCIASQLKRPLLPITCGDIGTTAQTAEATLEFFCVLAHRWRCVLLLDEADVFLAKREKGDIIRNSLVSVFLRVLEYYSGVIILTTNRVGEFDEAFRSRIHMSLYYPKLDEMSTKEIWAKNLQHIIKSGRDIDIEEDKIRRIAQTSAHFDDYISNIHGTQEDDTYRILAEREEIRKDTYNVPPSNQSMQVGRPKRNPPPPRRRIYRRNSGLPQSRGYEYEDDNESSEEDIERLKLKLELAKLKNKKGKNEKVESDEESDEEEDAAW